IRMIVKYSDYVVGHGKVTITEVGEAPSETIKSETPKLESKKPDSQMRPSTTTAVQPETTDEVKPVEGGILNDRATSLPAPKYPATGTKVHASGQVQVKVLIDETGKVISAEAVFGPELLKAA